MCSHSGKASEVIHGECTTDRYHASRQAAVKTRALLEDRTGPSGTACGRAVSHGTGGRACAELAELQRHGLAAAGAVSS